MIEVTTQEELKKAIESGAPEIIVKDEQLGDKIVKFMKIKKLSRWGLWIAVGIIIASIPVATVAAPATAGASYLVAPPAATVASGLSVSAIIAITGMVVMGVSLTTMYALYNGYECEIGASYRDVQGNIRLTKKKRDKE